MCDSGFSFSLSGDYALLDFLLFLLPLCVTLSLTYPSLSWRSSPSFFLLFHGLSLLTISCAFSLCWCDKTR